MRTLGCERGSASVEFSLLAIPLFIPLFIFMSQFSHVSDAQDSMRTLAREAARAFVTSKNDETAFFVANQIVMQGARVLGYEPDLTETAVELEIMCNSRPCISPDNRVLLQLTMNSSSKDRIEVAVVEYVSPWA